MMVLFYGFSWEPRLQKEPQTKGCLSHLLDGKETVRSVAGLHKGTSDGHCTDFERNCGKTLAGRAS